MNEITTKVREQLLHHAIYCTLLDLVFIKPLDGELITELLLTHSPIITLEEHSVVTGVGSIPNNFLLSAGFQNIKVLNLGIPDFFVGHGSYEKLMDKLQLTATTLVDRILMHYSLDANIFS